MASDRNDRSPFPTVVAWLSLGLAVALFFRNTVPALREHGELQATAGGLEQLRTRYDAALAHAWATTPENGEPPDLQAVLVAIDQIGWTPDELLRSYPEPRLAAAAGDAAGDPAGDPTGEAGAGR